MPRDAHPRPGSGAGARRAFGRPIQRWTVSCNGLARCTAPSPSPRLIPASVPPPSQTPEAAASPGCGVLIGRAAALSMDQRTAQQGHRHSTQSAPGGIDPKRSDGAAALPAALGPWAPSIAALAVMEFSSACGRLTHADLLSLAAGQSPICWLLGGERRGGDAHIDEHPQRAAGFIAHAQDRDGADGRGHLIAQ